MPHTPRLPPQAAALLACALISFGLAEPAHADPPGPLLDGRCDEYENLAAKAHPLRPRGFDRSQTPPRPRFESSPGRELQLSKRRFGRGEWQLRLHIQGLQNAQGEWGELQFPAADAEPLRYDSH